MTDYRFRPISTWPGDQTPPGQRRTSPFKAYYSTTIDDLENELTKLRAKDVVIEIALREQDIRNDGRPRSNAPQPSHPGVVVSFDSMHGPLRYATDRYTTWQANLRAIARGLNALRMVERYGITKRGEQYVGWKQLEAAGQSSEDAREDLRLVVLERASWPDGTELDDRDLVRLARRVAHPDAPMGSHDLFLAVQHAAETLGVA